ncbi:MAG: hypothetical protein CUR34_12990 [Sediminibacterium sp.]|nr:MAG: hypothetical protein CUR34_12990 [Sediminibacterium sp.] [Sediminibacterium sp. FEMGT703S]
MSTQDLRDRKNMLLGRIFTLGSGKQELRNNINGFKGTYDPNTNETRNSIGTLVGRGNLLTTLL